MVPQVVKPARVVWNQVIGFIFTVLSLFAIRPSINYYRTLDTEPRSLVLLIFTASFGIIMISFGIGSFLRARRISRS